MNPSINKELLRRYVNNACTVAERKSVERWLIDPAHHEQAKEMMAEHWGDVGTVPSPDLDHIWDRLDEQMSKTTPMEIVFVRKENPAIFLSGRWRNIAAVFLFLMVSAGVLHLLNADKLPDTTGWKAESTISTTTKISQISLPDGTKVWLNAESVIKYLPVFGKERREVFLEGEAYFDVTEDRTRPFIVYTKDIQVRVLGTAFTVKAYANDQATETTLLRGKVVIEKKELFQNKIIELIPNQRATYTRESSDLAVSSVEAEHYASWKSGVLAFENEPVMNVIRVLERWYNVKIQLSESISTQCTLTARIDNESLKDVLDLLSSVNGMTYAVSGSNVFIEGKICE